MDTQKMDTHSEKDTFATIERDQLYRIMISADREFDARVATFHLVTHKGHTSVNIAGERDTLVLAAIRFGIVMRYCEEMLRKNARNSILKESIS